MHLVISPCTANNIAELPQCSTAQAGHANFCSTNAENYLKTKGKKKDFCKNKKCRGCHKMTKFRTLPTNHEPKLHQCLASLELCKLWINYESTQQLWMSHLGSVADSEHRREGSFDKLLHKQWSKQCFLFARTRPYDAIEASLRFADRGNAESLNQDSRDEVWLNQKKSKMFQNNFVYVIAVWKWLQKYLPELHASLAPSSVKVLVPIENKVSSPFWRLAWENVKPQVSSKLHSLDWSISKVPSKQLVH